MKLNVQLMLICVPAALLIACDANQGIDQTASTATDAMQSTTEATTPTTMAENNENPFPEPGQFTINLTPGNVSIRANHVRELDILESIAAEANFDLLAGDISWKTVTVDIREDHLHAALTALINAYPYQIVYTPDTITRQEVLSEVVISEPLPPATRAGPGKMALEDGGLTVEEEDTEESEMLDPDTQAQLQALQSESAEIRAAAAENIEPTGDGLYALAELITSDPSPEVRIATTRALEFSDDPLAIQALVACLKDEYPAVLVECIEALGHIGDNANAAQLQPLLEHYDETVRNTASQAIENLQ